ncbi:MAG: hypothetical protein U0Q12_03455 [Vicinamibacterales bacterium]
MQRTVQAAAAPATPSGIDVRAADAAHRAGAAVLLVVGVQDEEHLEARARGWDGACISGLGHLEQHVQEVAREGQLVVRADVEPACHVAERVGGDGRRLGDEPHHVEAPRFLIEDVLGVAVEGCRERADRAQEHAHRVRVLLEALDELLDVLVEHRVSLMSRSKCSICAAVGSRR